MLIQIISQCSPKHIALILTIFIPVTNLSKTKLYFDNISRRGGQSPPVYWLLIDKHDPIPNNAIEGGRENGHPRYIGRVYYKSGLHIGKVATQLGGCVIGWGGKEHNDFDKYEVSYDSSRVLLTDADDWSRKLTIYLSGFIQVLVGDKHSVKWVNHAEHAGNIQVQGWQPVEGGKEADGRFVWPSR